MSEMSDRLRQARVEAGYGSASAAAAAVGINPSTYRAHENGQNEFGPEYATLYGRRFSVAPGWLLTGSGDERVEADTDFERHEERGAFSSASAYRPKRPGGVPEVDVQAGAGEGRVGEIVQMTANGQAFSAHPVVAEWVFSDDWLAELRAKSSGSIVLPIVGDSMRPNYQPGDRVLVDLRQTQFMDGVVFLISVDDDAPSVKRLTKVYRSDPPMVTVISDNEAIPNRDIEAEYVKIIGRIVGRLTRE
ncbi:LexA family transcriptional regulator [Fulvimarina endophytica]|uniref:LexA family transcriptional regulator n=1 Tax=Fulvimarina endophytica TaxID=2293836 RepID=A0A371XBA3_9HYPH|nr:LexA family transcriptional regulator [Fulvimarina endophytica]RFC66482.1 LexA family transcriptional regulator [Fulvimarina endophytica]